MKFIRYWLPVIIYMAAIFIASSRQKVAISDSYAISFLIFKTMHIIEYVFFYLVCYRAFRNTVFPKHYAFFYSLLLILVYAISDEIHQAFIPTREGRFRDVIIDLIGGGFGWVTITQFLPKAPKKLKTLAKRLQVVS